MAKLHNPVDFQRPPAEGVNINGKSNGEAKDKTKDQDTKGMIDLPTPEPWREAVDGVELVDDIVRTIESYVVLPPEAAKAAALWVIHAHTFDAFQVTPRLSITSPEKRCGKSTLLHVLAKMVPRALLTSNITAAVLYRVVESSAPTVIVDEADTFLAKSEELRGILNAGHTKGLVALRMGGANNDRVESFHTFAPLIIAQIGKLPGTLEDRSVSIRLRRRAADEHVVRLRLDRVRGLETLGEKAARWAMDSADALPDIDPAVPGELHDRAADNWRPLLAIAERIGGDWPETARMAAVALSSGEAEEGSRNTRLLADIKKVFDSFGADRMKTTHLINELLKIEDAGYVEWSYGKQISPAQLSRTLKPFGIRPHPIRIGDGSPVKGYRRSDFEDAWRRYLPPASGYSVTSDENQ